MNITKPILCVLTLTMLCGCPSTIKKPFVRKRADQYFKDGQYDKAKIEYLSLLRVDPKDVAAYERLGYIWMDEGAPLRAIPFLLKARELAPKDTAARLKLALCLLLPGATSDARKEALAVLQQDRANAGAIVILAEASRTKEEIAEAQQQLSEFSQKESASFHLAAASLALRNGNRSLAADELEQ